MSIRTALAMAVAASACTQSADLGDDATILHDACSETRLDLLAPGWTSALVSDDERGYWVWNADDPGDMKIRSTPRLDAR